MMQEYQIEFNRKQVYYSTKTSFARSIAGVVPSLHFTQCLLKDIIKLPLFLAEKQLNSL